jgi:predicted RNA-binding Zn ribbon-like protein
LPRYDLPNPAPEPLRLVQLFVNTVDHEHGREWLPTPDVLDAWLDERSLPHGRVGEAELRQAVELREALRTLLRDSRDRAAIAVVNRMAMTVELEPDGPRIRSSELLGPIVAVVFEAMLDGSWRRLKACPQCGWAFYDYSKNRSATWCSMAICGNRLKTRAYRRRRAGERL